MSFLKIKTLFSALLCALLVAVFISCSNKEISQSDDTSDTSPSQEQEEQTNSPVTVPDVNDDKPDVPDVPDETPEAPTEPIIQEPAFINPLTGLASDKDLTNKRPVAVMINNLKQALPQIAVSEAEVVYETLEEGGITRLLCIYNDYSDIPEIGSIRSTRDYYIDVTDAHDAILVHAGASTYAYTALAQRNTSNLDGLYLSQFYRSPERMKTMSREHTLMISGSGIDDAISYKGYRTTSEKPSPLVFDQNFTLGSTTANHISIPFSIGYNANPYITSYFDYGSTSKLYHKGHFNTPHIDGDDGQQLAFKNVITLTCPMNIIKGDPLGCIQVHFTGTGKGTYFVEGTSREIVWSKPSRGSAYTLYESDGETPLVLAPGKSYIAIVPTGTNITVNE